MLVAACVLFVLVVIILIVALVKLHHRNLELDDLYDEYGIDLDEEQEKAANKKDKKADKKSKKKDKLQPQAEETDFDEGFEDYEDDDEYDLDGDEYDSYDEEDYDEDYEEDYDSFVRGGKRSYGDVSRRSRVDDEEDIEDLDALLNARVREPAKRPKKAPERRSHAEEDDTFKMDIIDLD